MNTTKFPLLVVLQFAFSVPALAASESRDLDGFNAIDIGGGIDLYIQQGDRFNVEVVATRGDTDDVVTELSNDTLTIHHERSVFSSLNWFADYKVNITLPALESLSASGGSDVKGENTFSGNRLEITTSGGTDLSIEVDVDALEIRASGGSDTTLSGSVNRLHAQTSGGSDIHASGLTAKEADLTSSGGSDIDITVVDRLTAKASGGSDIQYRGNPGYTDIDDSGGADVTHR